MAKAALIAELRDDPLARGYAAMTADQVATSLNTKNRTRNRASVPVSEIIDAIEWAEYDALAASHKSRLNLILARDTINANSTNVKAAFLAAFTNGSATRAALIALLVEPISRAVEIGLTDSVGAGLIEWARAHG